MVFHLLFSLAKFLIWTAIQLTGIVALPAIIFLLISALYIRIKKKQLEKLNPKVTSVAFFHPYCNSGGGGEKVLWCIIKSIFDNFKDQNLQIVVYTGDNDDEAAILKKAKDRFNLSWEGKVTFIRVSGRTLIAPKPFLTIFFQIIGTILYTIKALVLLPPDIFIDTTGLAFSFVAVKYLLPKTKIGAYVHYPFVSHEMLQNIENNKARFNNNKIIAKSKILSQAKIIYYKISIKLYEKMGDYVDLLYTNSTWTDTHIRRLWKRWTATSNILYPPCNVSTFSKMPAEKRGKSMLSFAQFRPEKNHELQLRVFKRVQDDVPEGKDLKFMIMGSCRGPEDHILLDNLKRKAEEMNIKNISFHVNLPYDELLKLFGQNMIGIHTMEAEHFGIAIVEMISAGLIVVTHNSAGPRYDIIRERKNSIGHLCLNEEEYVSAVTKTLKMSESERLDLVSKGREEMKRYSDEAFMTNFSDSFRKFLSP